MDQRSLSAGMKLSSIISVIALACAFGAPWAFANERSERDREDGKTIVLIGTHVASPPGFNTLVVEPSTKDDAVKKGVGNRNLFSDDLRYAKNTEVVAGRNSAVCTTTSPFADPPNTLPAYKGANLCTLGFVLFDRGKITVSGIVTDEDFAAGTFLLPIVGGTGEFKNARGEYEVKGNGHGAPATLTFRLK